MKVLLAQFRKPPVESRFFDRIGAVLARSGMMVLSAGNGNIKFDKPDDSTICILPVFQWPASSGNWQNLQRLWQLMLCERPAVLIYSSPEISLLIPLIRLVFPGLEIVFDLQENHGLNFRKQTYRPSAAFLFAAAADLLVWLGRTGSHRIWLAEKIYQTQFPGMKRKSGLVENFPSWRYTRQAMQIENPFALCFTGFISRESGILQAIELVKTLRQNNPAYHLLVCGYCADSRLREEILQHPFIHCTKPLESWASDEDIFCCMQKSAAQLMAYEETEANLDKTPSKWYASLACGLPVWYNLSTGLDLPERDRIGFPIDFRHPGPDLNERWMQFLKNFQPDYKQERWEGFVHLIEKEMPASGIRPFFCGTAI